MLGWIDTYQAVMGEAAYDNFELWPMEDIEFSWDGTNWLCPIDTFDNEMVHIRDWALERLAWIDANIHEY